LEFKDIKKILEPHIVFSGWVDMTHESCSVWDVETEKDVPTDGLNGDSGVVIVPFVVAMKLFPVLKKQYVEKHLKSYIHETFRTCEDRLLDEKEFNEKTLKNSLYIISDAIYEDILDCENNSDIVNTSINQ
jgi:hypothetical protein